MAKPMKRARLKAVEALPGYVLRLVFVNDRVDCLSLEHDINTLPGLAPLRDAHVFNQAQVIEGEGWAVEWPDVDIQIGADTLWLDAQAQATHDENARIFLQWRARHGLSLSDAARVLELTPRTLSAYGTGKRAVPRYIALACKGWEAENQATA